MKKILFGTLALAALALAVTSCNNDKKEDAQNNATQTDAPAAGNTGAQVYEVDVEGAETVTEDVDGKQVTDVVTVDKITPEN